MSYHQRLTESYCNVIKQYWPTISAPKQRAVTTGLETLLMAHFGEDALPTANGRAGPKDSCFDPEKLKEVRLASGITQNDLAKQLGFSQSQAEISRMENGKTMVEDSAGPLKGAYVEWLKERGYNPLGI